MSTISSQEVVEAGVGAASRGGVAGRGGVRVVRDSASPFSYGCSRQVHSALACARSKICAPRQHVQVIFY